MTRYHISPAKQEPMVCKAQTIESCGYSQVSKHFDNIESAYEHIETIYKARTLNSLKKVKIKVEQVTPNDEYSSIPKNVINFSTDWNDLPKHVKLTGERARARDGSILHRIKSAGPSGRKGGWIQYPHNVGPLGWVAEDAQVLEESQVRDGAVVAGTSIVRGKALITGKGTLINDNVYINGYPRIENGSKIGGNVKITEGPNIKSSIIVANSKISGESLIIGSKIQGSAEIRDRATVKNSMINDMSIVMDNSIVENGSSIMGESIVRDSGKVSNSILNGKSMVSGNAELLNGADLQNQRIGGNVVLSGGGVKSAHYADTNSR